MTDLEQLWSRVARLAEAPAPVRDGARILSLAGTPPPLQALQREIEETQLPRALTFRNTRAEKLEVQVKSGRIVRIGTEAPSSGPEARIVGLDLADKDPDHITLLGAILTRFTYDTRDLSVVSGPLAGDISPVATGIPPRDCFAPLPPVNGGTRRLDLTDLTTRLSALATAWLMVTGDEVCETVGEQTVIQGLCDIAQYALDEQISAEEAADPPKCILLSADGDNATAILTGRIDDTLIVMVFPAAALTQVHDIWRDVTA